VPQSGPTKKLILWTAGAIGTALIGLLVTGILPKAIEQIINGSKVEDSLRHGPDIVVSASLYYPDGSGVPLPTVATGNYQPSSEFISALAHPMAATSPLIQKQLRQASGVDFEDTYIRLILRGNRNEKILILGVRPVQLRRTQPLNGVFFAVGAQGDTSNIQMGFNLDQLSPQALNMRGSEGSVMSSVPFFKTHSISLADNEQAVVVIEAQSLCYSAQFKLAIDYTINGANKEILIGANGGPFAVTGPRFGPNNVVSYRQTLILQGNFSVTPPTPTELSEYNRTAMGVGSCPS
jgi:hypothetical protein